MRNISAVELWKQYRLLIVRQYRLKSIKLIIQHMCLHYYYFLNILKKSKKSATSRKSMHDEHIKDSRHKFRQLTREIWKSFWSNIIAYIYIVLYRFLAIFKARKLKFFAHHLRMVVFISKVTHRLRLWQRHISDPKINA